MSGEKNIYLVWKGQVTGPFTSVEIQAKIARREISLLHHVRIDEETFTLSDWLESLKKGDEIEPRIATEQHQQILQPTAAAFTPPNGSPREAIKSPLKVLAGIMLVLVLAIKFLGTGESASGHNETTVAAMQKCTEAWGLVAKESPDISAALQTLDSINITQVSSPVLNYAKDFRQCLMDLKTLDEKYKSGIGEITSAAQNDAIVGGAILGFVAVAFGDGTFEDSFRRGVLSGVAANEYADAKAKEKIVELTARLEPAFRQVYTNMQNLRSTHDSLASQFKNAK